MVFMVDRVGLGTTLVGLPPPLDILLGPLTRDTGTAFDTLYATQEGIWENETTANPYYNYYDRAGALYRLGYRTGVQHWLTTADTIAKTEADTQMLPANLDGSGRSNYAARDYNPIGMAVHYIRTGYANSIAAVRAQAAGGAFYWNPLRGDNINSNPRDAAYAWEAMLCSTLLGGGPDYSTDLAAAMNAAVSLQGQDYTVGSTQSPNEFWQCKDGGSLVPATYYFQGFFGGLYTEAIILHDRIIGDSRAVTTIKNWVDWQWANQWVPNGGGFPQTNGTSTTSLTIGTGSKTFTTQAGLGGLTAGQPIHALSNVDGVNGMVGTVTSYSGTTLVMNSTLADGSGTVADWTLIPCQYPGDQTANGIGNMQYANITSGTVSTASNANYACLLGPMLPAFGYVYAHGGSGSYKDNGNALVASLQPAIYFLLKQVNEAFKASATFLGWTA